MVRSESHTLYWGGDHKSFCLQLYAFRWGVYSWCPTHSDRRWPGHDAGWSQHQMPIHWSIHEESSQKQTLWAQLREGGHHGDDQKQRRQGQVRIVYKINMIMVCINLWWWKAVKRHFFFCGCRCPVGGCINDRPVKMSDLEENKELRRFIEKKARQEGKRPKKGIRWGLQSHTNGPSFFVQCWKVPARHLLKMNREITGPFLVHSTLFSRESHLAVCC